MKKIIAIGLLLGFLNSTTEVHELLKLPHLIHHYFEHGADTGLFNFLHIHYAHDHDQDNHQDEHHDRGCLPFQGSHSCQTVNISALYFETGLSLNLQPDISNSNQYYPVTEFAVSQYQANIWQPPKIG